MQSAETILPPVASRSRRVPVSIEALGKLDVLDAGEAAAYLRTTPSQLAKMRYLGGGPVYVKPSKRKTLYRRADLDAWLAANAFASTSAEATGTLAEVAA